MDSEGVFLGVEISSTSSLLPGYMTWIIPDDIRPDSLDFCSLISQGVQPDFTLGSFEDM